MLSVGDGIARVHGLENAMAGEMLELPHGVVGLALNLEEENVGAVLFGEWEKIKEGDTCKRTGRAARRAGGRGAARPRGQCARAPDRRQGRRSTPADAPVEFKAPGRRRAPAGQGADADRAQGDRRDDPDRPRPARADHRRPPDRQDRHRDRHDHQSEGHGRRLHLRRDRPEQSTVAQVAQTLEEAGAMRVHDRRRGDRRRGGAAQVHRAVPGCAMGEYFLYSGRHALCVYDDLSKHAHAYRQLSLLLRRPPGREAYPGDVFYLHSRLLERAVKLNDELGGGSLTALPIIETQAGDVSAYIPTNVISITDGQIFLESDCSTRACARPSTSASRCRASAAPRRSRP